MTSTMPESSLATLERAFHYILGRCDGARTEDGNGFNKYDAMWALQAEPRIAAGRGFSNPESAHKILTKYRKQLLAGGIVLPAVDVVIQERETAAATPTPARTSGPQQRVGTTIELFDMNMLRVAFPYDAEKLARLKAIQGSKKYNPQSKTWELPLRSLDDIVKALPDAVLLGDLGAKAEQARANAIAAAVARKAAIERDLVMLEQVRPQWMYDYQVEGSQWLIEQRAAILADDMGLGKTVQALVAARAIGHRIIVIGPAGLRDNWLEEAAKVEARIEYYSWSKVPPALTGAYTIIADEAHYAQNMKAQRTKNLLAIAAGATCVFLLSGTPIKNGRPANLFPLLSAIKHRLAANRKAYEIRYCNAGPTKWSAWDATGAAFLEELHAETADSILRRLKTDKLNLPPKTRIWEPAELSAEATKVYQDRFAELQAAYNSTKAQKKAALEAEGKDTSSLDNADALVLLGHLNHAGAVAKIEGTVEKVRDIVEEGGQVVLFSRYKETVVDVILAELAKDNTPCGRITGDEDSTQRQDRIKRFQAGDLRVMVCTYAGGVGVTLTAAQDVILIDRPWTPGDAEQLEDRIFRIGQTKPTFARWIQYGEFDAWLDDEVLQGKQQRSQTVLTGTAKSLDVSHQQRKPRTAHEFAAEIFG